MVKNLPAFTEKVFLSKRSTLSFELLYIEGVYLGFLIEIAGNIVARLILFFTGDFISSFRLVFFFTHPSHLSSFFHSTHLHLSSLGALPF